MPKLVITAEELLGKVLTLPSNLKMQDLIEPGSLGVPASNIVELDGSTVSSNAELFVALAHVLKFQPYFGHNWDALDECLMDLEDWEGEVILVINQADKIRLDNPESYTILMECLKDMVEIWRCTGTPKITNQRGVLLFGSLTAPK